MGYLLSAYRSPCQRNGIARNAITKMWQRVDDRVQTTTALDGETYNSVLDWKSNGKLSRRLTDHLSHQASTVGSRAMDYEYLRSHIGGNWHRLYDSGHSIAGSWKAVSEALPDLSRLEQLVTWANEYWKALITTRAMPVVILDHIHQIIDYFKHLDSANVAQSIPKFGVAFTMVLSLFASSSFAQTEVSGTVSVLYASPGSDFLDPRKCTFFQINNADPWYAIPFSDPGYESELILLRDSYIFGRTLNFTTYPGAPTCGWSSAYDIYIGTAH